MTYAEEAENYKLVLAKDPIKLSPGPEVKSLGESNQAKSLSEIYAEEAENYELVLPKGPIKLSPGPQVKSLGVPSTNEYVRAGQVAMSAKDCKELAVNVSTVAFSPDKSSNYSLMNLKKANSFNYFDTTRKEIQKELDAYCENEKSLKTVQDFQDQFHSACGSTCSNNLDKFYKKPTFGSNKEKDNADLTCLSICNRTNDNLDFLKHGARLSEKQRKPETSAAGDCNGRVSALERGFFKAVERDLDMKYGTSTTAK